MEDVIVLDKDAPYGDGNQTGWLLGRGEERFLAVSWPEMSFATGQPGAWDIHPPATWVYPAVPVGDGRWRPTPWTAVAGGARLSFDEAVADLANKSQPGDDE